MNRPRPLFASLPAFVLTLGVGLCGYYGYEWLQLPEYSTEDIDASVEINLHLDLQRRGPHLQPDTLRLDQLRSQIREEIEHEIRHEREIVQTRFAVGLIALVVGLGQLLFQRMLRR